MSKTAKYVFIILVLLGIILSGVVLVKATPYKVSEHIYVVGNITTADDQEDIDYTIEVMNNLPEELESYFLEDDWKIIFVDDIASGASGQTIMQDKEILIRKGYARAILYHEFGHLIHEKYGISDDFKEIYEQEAEKLLSYYFNDDMSYFTGDEVEFFAHAYYVVKHVDCSGVAPLTSAYFKEIIK